MEVCTKRLKLQCQKAELLGYRWQMKQIGKDRGQGEAVTYMRLHAAAEVMDGSGMGHVTL